ALLHALPDAMLNAVPYLRSTQMDWRLAGFSVGVSLLTGLLFALAPALQLSLVSFSETLKEGGWGVSGSGWRKFGSGLVTAEVAIAVVLLVGAGLLLKSVYKLLRVDNGFSTDHAVQLVVVAPNPTATTNDGQRAQLISAHRRMVARLSALPGV